MTLAEKSDTIKIKGMHQKSLSGAKSLVHPLFIFYIMYVRRAWFIHTACVAHTYAVRDLLIRRMRKSRTANESRKAGRENKT